MMRPVILVTYRNREQHLRQFVPAIIDYLPEASIYVIEQMDEQPFNRGKLFNIGFLETQHMDCYYILHDVDMLPIDVDYSYCDQPTHLAAKCSQFDYKLPYPEYFGGVNVFSRQAYQAVNGFPNTLRGWGGEDDLLLHTCYAMGLQPARKQCTFKSLDHERPINQADYEYNKAAVARGRNFADGITTCSYRIHSNTKTDNYTLIKAIL